MVHVFLLKRVVGATVPVSAYLPPTNAFLQAEHTLARVLDQQTRRIAASHLCAVGGPPCIAGDLGGSQATTTDISHNVALGARQLTRRGEWHDYYRVPQPQRGH